MLNSVDMTALMKHRAYLIYCLPYSPSIISNAYFTPSDMVMETSWHVIIDYCYYFRCLLLRLPYRNGSAIIIFVINEHLTCQSGLQAMATHYDKYQAANQLSQAMTKYKETEVAVWVLYLLCAKE